MRPLGPFVAPDQFLMAPDSSCAMHDIVYSSYFYYRLKWMWPANIIYPWSYCYVATVYEIELQLLIVENVFPSKQLALQFEIQSFSVRFSVYLFNHTSTFN